MSEKSFGNRVKQALGRLLKGRDSQDDVENKEFRAQQSEAERYSKIATTSILHQEWEKAEYHLLKAMEHNEKAGNLWGKAIITENLGAVYTGKRAWAEAKECFLTALKLYGEFEDSDGIVSCHNRMGDLYRDQLKVENAEEEYSRAIELHGQNNDYASMAWVEKSLGDMYCSQGDLKKAEQAYLRAIELYGKAGDSSRRTIMCIYKSLDRRYGSRGGVQKPGRGSSSALEVRSSTNNFSNMAEIYRTMSGMYGSRNEWQDAEKSYLKASELYEQAGDPRELAHCYNQLAVLNVSKDKNLAKEFHLKALKIGKEINDLQGICSNYHELGVIYLLKNEQERAEEAFLNSLEVCEELGALGEMKELHKLLKIIYLDSGEWRKLEESCLKLLEISQELDDPEAVAHAHVDLGVCYLFQQNPKEAEESCLKALSLNEELKNDFELTKCSGFLGLVYNKQGNQEKAEEFHLKAFRLRENSMQSGGMDEVFKNLGTLAMKLELYEQAFVYLTRGFSGAQETGYVPHLEIFTSYLDELKEKTGEEQYNRWEQEFKESQESNSSTPT